LDTGVQKTYGFEPYNAIHARSCIHLEGPDGCLRFVSKIPVYTEARQFIAQIYQRLLD
jgi:hypothetical protein